MNRTDNKKIMRENDSRLEKLENSGWTMRFVACEPRLSEAVEVYEEAGFEVRLEDLSMVPKCAACMGNENNENDYECKTCFEDTKETHKVIFTKPSKITTSRD